jgi:XTP/dITP diphosphohydrolase
VKRLLVATTNPGKQREFARLLRHLPAEIVVPADVDVDLEVEEPHETYAENATVKADAYARASGLITVADDSGIEAAALDWGPGVRSARWGGGRQAAALLEALKALDDGADRRARMVCALAVAIPGEPDPIVEVFSGVIEGTVAHEPIGSGGFGYDPVFLLPDGRTTAQLPDDDKDRISHRGRAVAAATPRLRELLLGD